VPVLVGRVERALRKVPGVQDATVNLATESARISFAPGEQMEARCAARCAMRATSRARRRSQTRRASRRVALGRLLCRWPSGLVLSAPLVLPMVGDLFGAHWMLPAWLQFVLATPVQFILGARFYKAGWHALPRR
jgi:Cu+-exporting ATPase